MMRAPALNCLQAVDDASLTIGGHPSRIVFGGVRKVTFCEDPDTRPTDGTEISYNELLLRSESAIKKLVAGKSMPVEILDPFPDEDDLVTSEPANAATLAANGRKKRVV